MAESPTNPRTSREGGDEEEQVVSWLAVIADLPVIAADGEQVGHVVEVAALPEEDIFHGIVYRRGVLAKPKLAPAAEIDRITTRAVYLSVDRGATESHEDFQELHLKRLGLRGILGWKHLGWKDSSE